MEDITQIHSFSHGEFRRLYVPNSFEFEPGLSLIECKTQQGTVDFGVLLKICFNPENIENENREIISSRIEERNMNHCKIEFSTKSKDYLLKRIFWKDQTYELSITDQRTGSVVFDDEAGEILKRISSPILLISDSYLSERPMIYGGFALFSKGRMGAMATTWARTLGITTPSLEVDGNGIWYINDGWETKPISNEINNQSNAIHLLKSIAQAVVRKQEKGSCPLVYLDFKNQMSSFGLISLIDFVKGICQEHAIQFLISMREVPVTEKNILTISEYAL